MLFSCTYLQVQSLDYGTVEKLVHNAQKTNHSLVIKSLAEEKLQRNTTTAELDTLREQIKSMAFGHNIKTVQKAALKKTILDKTLADLFNTYLATISTQLSIPVKTNKIKEIITGSEKLLSDYADTLLLGNLPEHYSYNVKTVPILGDTSTALGNSKSTFLKAALLTLYCVLTNTENFAKLPLPTSSKTFWYDTSPLVFASSLPTTSQPAETIADYRTWSYALHDSITPNGILYPTSGYVFGGQRTEQRYPKGKIFGPEDCSSWISKLIGASHQFTTEDLLHLYRQVLEPQKITNEKWVNSQIAQNLMKILKPINITQTQDITPGLIYCHRNFSNSDPTQSKTAGISGHAALVLGTTKDGIATIGYNRNMPLVEGFGIEQFPFEKTDRKIMFFQKVSDNLQ